LELCDESIRYGSKHGVPVVIDIRDLWPEVFLDIIPKPSRPAAKAILYPFYRLLGKVCSGATAITGVSEAYVEWGLKRGNRRRSNFDKSFPLGYPSQTVQDGLMDARVMNWKKKKVGTDEGTMIVCFFGTVGRQFDLDTLIGAARVLRSENISIQFVLCGSGDKFGHYKAITSNDSNIILPGWIDLLEIQSLMSISSIGLAPYKETNNFLCNYGNKTAEYLSAGLPIALSLEKGILHDLLIRQECGFSYGENPYYLANKLKDLFLHPEKLNRLSANAEQTYEEFFKAEIVYQKMMNYLSELANKYKTR
jgi:glycosyltransferase involved in cell wall biosynthesis